MKNKIARVQILIVFMSILLAPVAVMGQDDDQSLFDIMAYGPDSIREDVRVVLGAIVTEMRGLELPKEAEEILDFDAEIRQGLREGSFEYGGFRCIGVVPKTFRNSTDDSQTKILEGIAIFRDQIGRTTMIEFQTSYHLAQEKIIIREASCNSLYPSHPNTMLFFVPAEAVSENLLETQNTHAKLLKFISENALTREQLAATSGTMQKYFVFACTMDRIANEAKLGLQVSQSNDGSIESEHRSMDINYDGWHVAILRGQFRLKTEPEYFINVIYTPGNEAQLEERKARVVSLFSSMLQASPPTPVPTPAGHKLVAYYPFNGDTQDHSGNGNHGTNHGATFVSGVSGQALSFDGKDDYVEVPDDDSLDINDEITVEAWINADEWAGNSWGGTIVDTCEWPNDVEKGYVLRTGDNGKLSFNIGNGNAWIATLSNPVMSTNKWYHIAGTFDGTVVNVFINGVEMGSTATSSTTIAPSAYNLNIGRGTYDTSRLFDGTIDEVKIYNYALTASEIKANYNKIKPTPTPIASTLTWKGMDKDKVSRGNGPNPDGDPDGHFSLTLTPKGSKTVNKITLLSTDKFGNPAGGHVWNTVPDGHWILGVEQPSGNRLNPTDKSISKTITTTTTFELYGANSGKFKEGQHFKAVVEFTDGTSSEAITTVSKTTTPTPTSYPEATLTHSGFDFSEGTTGESPIRDGEVISWQPGHAGTHPDYPDYSEYLWWRNTHLDDVNYASQTKDMGAVDIATVRAVPAEWDKPPLIPPLLVGHTIVAKCYDGYVKFQVISVDTADESARVKYSYSPDTTFAEGTPTPTPIDGEDTQWASDATASSEYSSTGWSAKQATGAPNTATCGDIRTAWAPKSSGSDPEWLKLTFDTPVHATKLRVHETHNAGFIYRVDLVDINGGTHTIWEGSDTTSCPGWFEITFSQTTYLVRGVILHTRINGWEEIDAVQLVAGAEEVTPMPSPTPAPTPGACDWTGTWNTGFGKMELVQTGNQVTGTYEYNNGKIEGLVSGNTLTGTWSEYPSYSPPGDAGDIVFIISEDCSSFDGKWRYGTSGDWSENWTGTRTGAAPTTTPTPTPTPSPTQQLKESELLDGNETPICTEVHHQWDPAISGDRVVWTDDRDRKGNIDIYMYDLSTGVETPICTEEGSQKSPAIYGDRVVWEDERKGNIDIYMYDLSTGVETPICTEESCQKSPAIYGDRVVWEDYRNGNRDIDIYMYDLSTGVETVISTEESSQVSPAIYGDWVVWVDNWDIYMYDLSTGVETPICTEESCQMNPAIYGNRVVWGDYRNGNWDIYMYDMSTGVEIPICTEGDFQGCPAISGDRVVWQDERNDGISNIYRYDMSTGVETQICPHGRIQQSPAIYGDRVVWQDDRNDNSDIYMLEL